MMTKVKFIETDGQSDIQMYIFLYELGKIGPVVLEKLKM